MYIVIKVNIPYAMNVVMSSGKFACQKSARFMFNKLFEPILVQLLILHVVVLVLFYNNLVINHQIALF